MNTLNRLTNEQLAQKARITFNAHGHDYLSYKESNYIDRAVARHNTNGKGVHTSNEEIIAKLTSFPLLTVVKHHYKNNAMGTEYIKEWKKVSDDAWITI